MYLVEKIIDVENITGTILFEQPQNFLPPSQGPPQQDIRRNPVQIQQGGMPQDQMDNMPQDAVDNPFENLQKYIVFQKLKNLKLKLDVSNIDKSNEEVLQLFRFVDLVLLFYNSFTFEQITELTNTIIDTTNRLLKFKDKNKKEDINTNVRKLNVVLKSNKNNRKNSVSKLNKLVRNSFSNQE